MAGMSGGSEATESERAGSAPGVTVNSMNTFAGQHRLAVFTAFRACIPLFTLVGLAAAQQKPENTSYLAMLLTVQVALTAATMAFAMRWRHAARLAIWLGILGDLVVITLLVAATGGAAGPLTFLYTIEAVAAGILLSSRLGLRVLAISMAAIIGLDLAAGQGLIQLNDVAAGVTPKAGDLKSLLAVAVLWTTAGGALIFSTLNERDIRRHAAELQTIRRITLDIEDSLSLNDIMSDLCRGVVEGFEFTSAAVLVVGGESDTLICAGGHNVTGSTAVPITIRGPLEKALRGGAPVVVSSTETRSDGALSDLLGARGYIAVPLGPTGLLVATRTGRGRRGGVVRAHEIEALQGLAHHASLAIANATLHEHVTAIARTDPLTGLHNHGEFQRILADELGRLDRYSSLRGTDHQLSLLLLDIDHFKVFNDTYGHQSGDTVLRGVADALRDAVRTFDHPARYGGEEMVAILPETGTEAALVVAERVRQAIESYSGGPARVTVSIGVATAPSNGRTATDLISAADAALYTAKRKGRNRVTVAPSGIVRRTQVVPIEKAKSRRSQQDERRAGAGSPHAPARSSRPTRQIPRA